MAVLRNDNAVDDGARKGEDVVRRGDEVFLLPRLESSTRVRLALEIRSCS